MGTFFWDDCITAHDEKTENKTRMTRQEANRKIIEILANAVDKFPDWRFCQILQNLGVDEPGCDNFYTESKDTLNTLYENPIVRGIS